MAGNVVKEANQVVANARTTVESFVAATGKGAGLLPACDVTLKANDAVAATSKANDTIVKKPENSLSWRGSASGPQSSAPKAGL